MVTKKALKIQNPVKWLLGFFLDTHDTVQDVVGLTQLYKRAGKNGNAEIHDMLCWTWWKKGGKICKAYPIMPCFVCRRFLPLYPSAVVHGGQAVKVVVIPNPSNSAHEQQHGRHRKSMHYWKSWVPKREKTDNRRKLETHMVGHEIWQETLKNM